MGLDYNSTRIFAMTLGRRAIDDVRRDGLRQLRNYVDMCAFLAKDPLARTFFDYAQTVLEQPDPPYYIMTQRLIRTVSENTLCTLGVNFGFGCMLYGSEKLAEAARQGLPAAWLTFSTSDDPELATEIEKAESSGSYFWCLYLKGPLSTALTELITRHPQSVFHLVIEPEYLTKSGAAELGKLPNVMPSVYLKSPSLTPAAREAFTFLSEHHTLQAAFLHLDASQLEEAFQSAWLEELARYTPACIFSRKAGMPEDASEDLRRRIWSDRLKADGQLFLIDLESDLAVISSHMPMQVSTRVRPIISPDMPMCH